MQYKGWQRNQPAIAMYAIHATIIDGFKMYPCSVIHHQHRSFELYSCMLV
jgi:hypothetical protein